MVADLYHYGHSRYLENTNNKLYVGIHNDIDAQSYKRNSVLNMYQRLEVLKFDKYINKLILDDSLILWRIYKKSWYICITYSYNRTAEEINEWYKNIINKGIKIEKLNILNEFREIIKN